MECVICREPGCLDLIDIEPAEPAEGEAVIAVRRIGVCGTDLHAVKGTQPFFEYPRILGHELAGEVVDVTRCEGSGLSPGDRVAVNPYISCGFCVACRMGKTNCCANLEIIGVQLDGGMREFLCVPAGNLLPADGLPLDDIALVECLTIGGHAARRAEVRAGEWALVVGCGPIGIGVMQFAASAGARIIAIDISSAKLQFCSSQFGVEHTINPGDVDPHEAVREITGGDNATLVYECTGNRDSMILSYDFVSAGGRLVFVGVVKGQIEYASPGFHKRELTALSSRNGTLEDLENVIACLREGTIQGRCIVTHRASLAGSPDAIDAWLDPESDVIKAMIEPGSKSGGEGDG